jgi:hypothetical protein
MKHTIFAGFPAARLFVAAFLATFVFSTRLLAAPTDAEANKTIDSAINTHYASADIAKAEKTLLDLIAACSNQCSAPTVARAWMYVGIVRGSGKDDLAGAQKAFAAAKKADPNVKLDDLFATELVKRVFQQTTAGGAEAMPLMGELQARAGEVEAVSSITCTLAVTDVETQRPIPFACRAPAGTARMVLSYKHESTTRWHELPMTQSAGYWTTEIPCSETKALGVMAYRIQALNAQGQPVDSLGSEQDPKEINLVDQTSSAPPSLPNTPAPESCRPKKVVEAAAGPLLGGYGQACSSESQCQGGLACVDGKCSADISCESDSDCASGTCDDGLCNVSAEECEGAACSKVPKNWIGLTAGWDFAMMSGTQVCDVGSTQPDREAFSCFENGEPYQGRTNHNLGGDIESGFRPATVRLMVGYERVLLPFLSVEARLGFAFNGGPDSPAPAGDGSSFMPFHAEARGKIFFSKVYQDDGRGLKGLSGYFSLGGGLAQVDPKVTVPVGECVPPPRTATITPEQAECINSNNQAVTSKDLDVYKRLGQSFIAGGPGLRYGITKNIAANLQLTGMFLLPSSGFALTPSLGVGYGF